MTTYTYDDQGRRASVEIGSGSNSILTSYIQGYAGTGTIVRFSEVWDGSLPSDPPSPDDGTLRQRTETSLDGLETWVSMYGAAPTHTETIPPTPSTGRQVVRTFPDGTQEVMTYNLLGQLHTVETKDTSSGVLTKQTYSYDEFGRVDEVDVLGNGVTAYTYYDDGRIASITTPDPGSGAQVTTYAYTNSVANGQTTTVTLPDESEQLTEYTKAGQQKRSSGDQTYRVEYTYDYAGRMETMTTFQDGGSGAATTTWIYNTAGLLERKEYNDGKGTDYTYTASGRLKTRTWERGVTTTYGYEVTGDKRGVLLSVTYDDSTPAVTYSDFDRQGRPREIADASGTRELTYTDGQLTEEEYTAGPLDGFKVSRDYNLFRQSFAELENGETSVHRVDYGYSSTTGRLETVEHGTHTATYGYKTNTSLLASTTYDVSSSAALTITRDWDNLNRLVSITNAPSAASPADMSFTYSYNDLNQRTAKELEGGDKWVYDYDSFGQVVSAHKEDSGEALWPGYDFGYTFDDIGNRLTATRDSETSTYTPNLLNQYTQRTVPGMTQIRGQADSAAVVTVNTETVTRKDGYFYKKLAIGNSSDSIWEEITVRGVLAEAGRDDTDAVAEEYLGRWVPETPEAFQYDDDGNLTQDGRWDYEWNGENRLIAMETRSVAHTAGAPRERLEFVYDSQGRRVQKTHLVWDEGETAFVEKTRDLFFYDGWNLLAELRAVDGAAEPELHRRYAWGMDLSGSLQGAGGVGGLLMVILADETVLYPAYDGNGNVMGLFDPDADDWAAEYEYGAFGEPLKAVGPLADANPFRFSTKYTDAETELVYYGFRYYVPEMGRWLNRDPIEEAGGLNLYGFVGNDGVNEWDYLGLRRCRIMLYFGHGSVPGEPSYQMDRANEFLRLLDSNNLAYAKALKEWQQAGRRIAQADREGHEKRKPVNPNDSLYCGIGGCQPQVSNAIIPARNRAIRDLSIYEPFYVGNLNKLPDYNLPGYIKELISSGDILPHDMLMERGVIQGSLTDMAKEAFKNACGDGCDEVEFSFYGQSDPEPVLERNSDGSWTTHGQPPRGPSSIFLQDPRFGKSFSVKCPCE